MQRKALKQIERFLSFVDAFAGKRLMAKGPEAQQGLGQLNIVLRQEFHPPAGEKNFNPVLIPGIMRSGHHKPAGGFSILQIHWHQRRRHHPQDQGIGSGFTQAADHRSGKFSRHVAGIPADYKRIPPLRRLLADQRKDMRVGITLHELFGDHPPFQKGPNRGPALEGRVGRQHDLAANAVGALYAESLSFGGEGHDSGSMNQRKDSLAGNP